MGAPSPSGWCLAIAAALLLVGCSSAATEPTPSLSADDLEDASYMAALIDGGVDYSSREDALLHGTTVCVYLDQPGTNIAEAIVGLVEEYGYSDEDAGYLAGTAISVYCPEHKP